MRQIIDYFLVVNDFSKNVFLNNDELLVVKDTLQRELKYLGLWKFARALIR